MAGGTPAASAGTSGWPGTRSNRTATVACATTTGASRRIIGRSRSGDATAFVWPEMARPRLFVEARTAVTAIAARRVNAGVSAARVLAPTTPSALRHRPALRRALAGVGHITPISQSNSYARHAASACATSASVPYQPVPHAGHHRRDQSGPCQRPNSVLLEGVPHDAPHLGDGHLGAS